VETSARVIDHTVLDNQSLIHLSAGWTTLRRSDWFVNPKRRGYLFLAVAIPHRGDVRDWMGGD